MLEVKTMKFKRKFKSDKRFFGKNINKVHSKNLTTRIPRGGIRL